MALTVPTFTCGNVQNIKVEQRDCLTSNLPQQHRPLRFPRQRPVKSDQRNFRA